jgi:hypothetical protein
LNGENDRPSLLVSGSFNPVHEGHWGLAAAATRLTGRTAAFELSVLNVDKGLLAVEEIRRRLDSLAWRITVWLTRAPTFAEKALLFPGAIFAVGADTAARIVSPKYYGDRTDRLAQALALIRQQGCRFLVAGRQDAERGFVALEKLNLPETYRDLFSAIPEKHCRFDISSTQLRTTSGGHVGS